MAREGLTAFQAVNRNFEEAASILDLDGEMRSDPHHDLPRDLGADPGAPRQRRPRSSPRATGCSTTAPGVRTRAASATTPTPTSRRSGRWRR